ncbi:TIGR03936 family radical SAM-associated protein [Syntrophomonas erecta]
MRIRTEYSLGPELKFLSNLDVLRLMERALRRAEIPFALSEGFNPHIRISMGTVLPVGLWGQREYFDLELKEDYLTTNFRESLNKVLPPAIVIKACQEIPADTPSLMKKINSAAYAFMVKEGQTHLEAMADRFLSASSLVVKSRGKKKGIDKDLRDGIYKIDITNSGHMAQVNFWVSSGEPVNVRYDELLDLMLKTGVEQNDIMDIYRQGNYIRINEHFYSPLERVR